MLVKILNRLFKRRDIVDCNGSLYLRRWYLFRSERVGIFIHQFVRSDEDRALHDHPWDFIVIPLWRGYIEHNVRHHPCGGQLEPYANQTRVLPLLGTRWRRAEYKHRVELLECDYRGALDLEEDCPRCAGRGIKPAWSIFIRLRKRREWGFATPEGWIQWNRWWQEKCE